MKPVNRINKFFNKEPKTLSNKFDDVEFEKFDPSIVQNIVEQNPEEQENEFDQPENKLSRVIVSQDSQMLDTLSLWIGHTRTNITPKLAANIAKVEGVETLDVITRYRFRVGIGKLFNDRKIKSSIAELIKSYIGKKVV